MGSGGKRVGAGRPVGTKLPKTLAKEVAREFVRQRITQDLEPLVEAQIAHALGIRYLVVRNARTGKVLRVTEAEAREVLGRDEEVIEVWVKDPSIQAFTDLMNRAIDKPREQPHDIHITGDDEMVRRLHAGRARAAALKG